MTFLSRYFSGPRNIEQLLSESQISQQFPVSQAQSRSRQKSPGTLQGKQILLHGQLNESSSPIPEWLGRMNMDCYHSQIKNTRSFTSGFVMFFVMLSSERDDCSAKRKIRIVLLTRYSGV